MDDNDYDQKAVNTITRGIEDGYLQGQSRVVPSINHILFVLLKKSIECKYYKCYNGYKRPNGYKNLRDLSMCIEECQEPSTVAQYNADLLQKEFLTNLMQTMEACKVKYVKSDDKLSALGDLTECVEKGKLEAVRELSKGLDKHNL